MKIQITQTLEMASMEVPDHSILNIYGVIQNEVLVWPDSSQPKGKFSQPANHAGKKIFLFLATHLFI